MADKTIVSILEEKKEEIMSHIELAVIDSYMPDLCGFFEICMRGWGVGRRIEGDANGKLFFRCLSH